MALAAGDDALTFGELGRRATRLAVRLQDRGIGPESRVGVFLERSVELVVALLGVLEAGGAYVPLELDLPAERLSFIASEVGLAAVVTETRTRPRLPAGLGAPVVFLDVPGDPGGGRSGRGRAGLDNLAYVIYTSGSTGRPKGVMVPHRAIANRLWWAQESTPFSPGDRMLFKTPFSFDASIWELFVPLMAGAGVVVAGPEGHRDPAHLVAQTAERKVTALQLVPSLLALFLEEAAARSLPGLRRVYCGGEALGTELVERSRALLGVTPRNLYGPTEAAIDVTSWVCRPGAGRTAIVAIGRPITGLRVYLAGPGLSPAPLGARGELLAGGAGLARGYCERPALTAERFVPDPLGGLAGERLYRTGDVARRRADGVLEFLGRVDHQVKVRGVRIEVEEIEAVLRRHPAVREAAVVAARTAGGEPQLVGYVVPVPGGDPAPAAELRRHLERFLPGSMLPSALQALDALPRTASGKIDRGELAARTTAFDAAATAPPRGVVEELVAEVWCQVLGVASVARQADFFELGGHSLLATRIASRLGRAFGVEVPVRVLFDHPTVAGVGTWLEGTRNAAPPAIERRPPDAEIPLSFAQERLWFLDQLEPGGLAYSLPGAVRLEGPLEVAALALTVRAVVRRHEVLRTRFAEVDGRPQQVVAPPAPLPLPAVDLGGAPPSGRLELAHRLARAEARRPFDLARGPLLRVSLVRLSRRDHLLLFTLHHAVSDGWSVAVLLREMCALYGGFAGGRPAELPELPIQYGDFARWQRSWLEGEVLEEQLSYWRRQLAGAPASLELPADRPRPPVQSSRGLRHRLRLPAVVSRELRALARRESSTLFMLLLAAVKALLYRYTGRTDLVVGTDVANRHRRETEELIGFFVNQLVLRTDLSGRPTFRQLLERVRAVTLGAYGHQDLPFGKLVDELEPQRDLSRNPLFQVCFVLEVPAPPIDLPGLDVGRIEIDLAAAKFDLTLVLVDHPDGLAGHLEASADLFDATTVRRLAGHLAGLLGGVTADPDRRLGELPLLTSPERHQLTAEWQGTEVRLPGPGHFEPCFGARVREAPAAVAAVAGEGWLSYGELERRARRWAHALIRRGAGAETVVALLLDRGLDLLTAMLATFKAGAAYLPLDPAYPEERLRRLLASSGSPLALAADRLAPLLAPVPGLGVVRSSALAAEPDAPEGAAGSAADPGNLAYAIYTSGSTGTPKGAMVEQRGMVNHLWAKVADLGLTAGDRVAQTASPCFDISVWQFLAPLLVGGRVIVVPDEVAQDAGSLLDEVERRRITILETVPSLLRVMLEDGRPAGTDAPALRWLIVTGEALPADLSRRWLDRYPGVPLLNAYGPTECSDDVTHQRLTALPSAAAAVPIGRPVLNTRIHVLVGLAPVPLGTPGEVLVGGAGVGRGYLGAPGRTAAVFVPDPGGARVGERLYRTGDLGRWDGQGRLQFLGRADHQVKVRGFRIELGEIEVALAHHPEVSQAAVLARQDRWGGQELVAYVVPAAAGGPEAAADGDVGGGAAAGVERWRAVFDEAYSRGETARRDPGANLRVWVSSYTGEPLPEEEILECVEDSVGRLLALQPRRVLEVGCGTGLLLGRIAPHCRAYWGTDISGEALARLRHRLEESPLEPGDVHLLERPADDLAGVPASTFDLVVLNEVVQYFPGIDYLVQALDQAAAAAAPGAALFVGGVRSLPLLETFHAAVALHRAPADLPAEELRRRVADGLRREKELAVDPEFFRAYARCRPRIGDVTFQLKGGRSHNELTRFRYDVILTVGDPAADGARPARELDWFAAGLTVAGLARMLRAESPISLAVRRIPNPRLSAESRIVELLRSPDCPATAGEIRREVAAAAEAVEPADLWALSEALPYRVEIFWGDGGGATCDALLRRRQGPAATEQRAAAAADAAQTPPGGWHRFANRPLATAAAGDLLSRLRSSLGETLPEYMAPAEIVLLESLPLTPNRKVDRRALAELSTAAAPRPALLQESRNPIEEILAALWAEVLGLPQVGTDEHFFELGGHSLLAAQVISRARRAFAAEIPLGLLFEHPTVAGLAAAIGERLESAGGVSAPPLVPVPRSGRLPLSFAQWRLWVFDQMEPGSPAYNVAFALRLEGALRPAALASAITEMARRHEVLRTTFALAGGEPFQVITLPVPVPVPVVDLGALRAESERSETGRLVDREARRSFDLARGPLFRVRLLRRRAEEHTALFTIHHAVSDAWSVGVILREVSALYEAYVRGREPALPELPVQYADFAVWQREWLSGEVLEAELAYWRRRLGDSPRPLELPPDHPRPPIQTFRGAQHGEWIEPALLERLNALSRREGATLFMLLVAVLSALLYHDTGREDVVVGTNFAGRNRRELEDLIGFFLNQLPLVVDLSGDPSFQDLLGRVRRVALEAYAHQELPFDRLVEGLRLMRDPARHPLFQIKVDMQNVPVPAIALPDLQVTPLPRESVSFHNDLTVHFEEAEPGLSILWDFNTDLYESATIRRFSHLFRELAAVVVERPEATVTSLSRHLAAFEGRRRDAEAEAFQRSRLSKLRALRRQRTVAASPAAGDRA